MLLHYVVQNSLSAVLIGGNALQSSESNDTHLLTIFVGIAAISLLILVLIVIGILIALVVFGLKAKTAAIKTVAEVKGKVYPIIDKTNGLVATLSPTIQSITKKADDLIGELSPKISGITGNVQGVADNVEHMSVLVRQKFEEFAPTLSAINQTVGSTNETVQDANRKTQQQVERVNSLVTSGLDKAGELSEALSRAVQMPLKSVAGLTTAAKVQVDALLSRIRFGRKGM
ncbi:MAG: hypothetical protein ACRYGF_03375 [Janthinobacterium lividum]